MKIEQCYVVGAGPVGCLTAALLSKHAIETRLVVSPRSKVKDPLLIKEHPKKYFGAATLPILQLSQLSTAPHSSTFWICTKAYDLEEALRALKPVISPLSRIIILSNGIEISKLVASVLGAEQNFYRLLYYFGAMLGADGELKLSGALSASLSSSAISGETAELGALLGDLGFKVSIEPSIQLAEWKKLLVNIVVNTIATLEDLPNGCILEDPKLVSLAQELLAETRALAGLQNIDLSQIKDSYVFNSIREHAQNLNSTLLDRRAGRKDELEFSLGKLLKIAKASGLACPALASMGAKLLNAK